MRDQSCIRNHFSIKDECINDAALVLEKIAARGWLYRWRRSGSEWRRNPTASKNGVSGVKDLDS